MENQCAESRSPSQLGLETTQQSIAASDTVEEITANPTSTHIFRPIDFESTPKSDTTENNSENGSEHAIDSAYSSDNPQSLTSLTGTNPITKRISASLQNKALWKAFKKIGNEMIVTKPGR